MIEPNQSNKAGFLKEVNLFSWLPFIIIFIFNWIIIVLQCCVTSALQSLNQLWVYIYPLPLEPPSHPPSISPLRVITEHQAELPVLYSSFPLAICFTHDSVYMLMLLSHFSHVRLCATPQTAAHQAPLSLGFSIKNTGVGCHFLLQCMKVKSQSEVAQLCPTLSDPMDCSLPGSSVHGIFQARVLEWGAIAFSDTCQYHSLNSSPLLRRQ